MVNWARASWVRRCGATWVASWFVLACGETTQPAPGDSGSTPTAGGGGVSSGGATSGGGSGGGPGAGCPAAPPSGACSGSLSCFYPGSSHPCAPPSYTATCEAGTWKTISGSQQGVCQEGCSAQVDFMGCPFTLPTDGMSCALCSSSATGCTYPGGTASCQAGVWNVESSDGTGGAPAGGAPAGGAAGEDGGANAGGAG